MLKKTFAGKAFLLGDHVNTDVLHPPDYFSLQRDRLCAGLSKGCAENFLSQMGPDDILIAGRNFGCGSSRESSAKSFKYNGIAIIVAESFARIFYRNMTNQGVYLLACPGILKKAVQGEQIVIDLEKPAIRSQVHAWELACIPMPAYIQRVLATGGLLKVLEEELS